MSEKLQQTPYLSMSGEATVINFIEQFYNYMDTLPQSSGVRQMHAEELGSAKQKLFKFLSGWLGGPDLFIQEYGHPRLRRRHFPFAISESAKGSVGTQYDSCFR